LHVLKAVLRWFQHSKKLEEFPMLEQLTGLLAALQGLDPMFVIAFMLCLHLLMKRRS